jgi:hypothetical protein
MQLLKIYIYKIPRGFSSWFYSGGGEEGEGGI